MQSKEVSISAPVVLTKLAIPRPPALLVERLPLWGRLRAALERHHRLVLLSAPAGFGKSTILSTWLAQDGVAPVAWLSLDAQDNHLDQFLAYFETAVRRVYPDLALASAFSPMLQGEDTYRVFFTALINALTRENRSLIVVLDDYHELTDQLIHNAVTFLLDHLPPTMHIFLTSRVDPPLPLARLRARQQLTELRTEDLRFTRDEMRKLFALIWREPPSEALVTLLEQRTEGWVAGLHLAALGLQHVPHMQEPLAVPLSLTQHYIFDYLAEEVFVFQPEETQHFLLRTAILPRLCGSLCDRVLGRDDSAAMLQVLERHNLFLTRLDDQGTWYRYHQLFADFLCRRLEQTTPAAAVAELHERASAWFEAQGVEEEAIHHALRAGAWTRALALLPPPARLEGVLRRPSLYLGWLDALPPELRGAPALQVMRGWALVIAGELAQVRALLSVLEPQLRPDEDPITCGVYYALAAYVSGISGAGEQTLHASQQALTLLTSGEPWLQAFARVFLAHGYRLVGQVRSAWAVLGADWARNVGQDQALRAFTIAAQAVLALMRADLKHAELWGEEVTAAAVAVGYVGVPHAYLTRALAAYERNDLTRAEELAHAGLQAGMTSGRARYWPGLPLLMARLLALRGQLAQRATHLGDALSYASQLANPRALAEVHAYRVEAACARGAYARAAQELAALGVTPERVPTYADQPLLMAQARLLLAQHRAGNPGLELGRAVAQLEELYAAAAADDRHDDEIKLLALRAVIADALQQPAQASALLAQALERGRAQGYLRSFVDLGEPLVELLSRPGILALDPDYVQQLRAACAGAPDAPSSGAPLMPALLSERELEILRLVASGRSAPAIADQLVISPHTTRSHIKSIYMKLEVHSRLEAVERARALKLL